MLLYLGMQARVCTWLAKPACSGLRLFTFSQINLFGDETLNIFQSTFWGLIWDFRKEPRQLGFTACSQIQKPRVSLLWILFRNHLDMCVCVKRPCLFIYLLSVSTRLGTLA